LADQAQEIPKAAWDAHEIPADSCGDDWLGVRGLFDRNDKPNRINRLCPFLLLALLDMQLVLVDYPTRLWRITVKNWLTN